MNKRITILSLLAMMTIAVQAQDQKEVKVLAKSGGVWMPRPEAVVDKKTKKKVAVWLDTENNSWHENIGEVGNVPVVQNLEKIIPDVQINTKTPYAPMPWQLTEENGETVLHCYFYMFADKVENLWLASEECVILDKETGAIYRSRRTVPDCYGKVFSVKGKEGTVLDFQIFFPKLPESTREIAIYGVPNWCLRGMEVTLTRLPSEWYVCNARVAYYDSIPQFRHPHLVSEAKDYNKDNHQTWAVYDDAHLINPVMDGTLAIWRTEEATYLAEACEMNWMREYFGRGGDEILIDQSGHQYKCKGLLDYPNDVLFWNEGITGDHFAIVRMFEPLPLDIETVTFIVPEGEPFAMWGASWAGKVQTLNIKELRENQRLFKYHPRVVVE